MRAYLLGRCLTELRSSPDVFKVVVAERMLQCGILHTTAFLLATRSK